MNDRIRKIVVTGILGAISAFLGITHWGFIPWIAGASLTIMHVPVIIGAVLEGPLVGVLIGLIFGVFSLIQAAVAPSGPTDVWFTNPLLSVLPRLLIGPASWLVWNALKKSPAIGSPAGKQTLNGTQALELARIRRKYSDVYRINNQTIVLQAVFNRMKNSAVIAKIPQIYDTMIDSVLTDLTPEKISTLLCLLEKIDSSSLVFYDPPTELLTQDAVFIPNMHQEMIIYHWDQQFIDWLHRSIWESK